MDVMEAIHSRGSVKAFRSGAVKRELLQKLTQVPFSALIIGGETLDSLLRYSFPAPQI